MYFQPKRLLFQGICSEYVLPFYTITVPSRGLGAGLVCCCTTYISSSQIASLSPTSSSQTPHHSLIPRCQLELAIFQTCPTAVDSVWPITHGWSRKRDLSHRLTSVVDLSNRVTCHLHLHHSPLNVGRIPLQSRM
jgi:hypothetical protein